MTTPTDSPMLSQATLDDLTQSLATNCLGKRIHFLESTESTNDIALQLARGGAEDGTVVIAAKQTAGRGRLQRKWHSPEGGLWMSVLLAPGGWPHHPTLLSLLSAVPFAQGIEDVADVSVGIKWTNDLRLKCRKVAGILGELQPLSGRGSALVLGVGVNANVAPQDFPFHLRATSTSLCEALGQPVDRLLLLTHLLQRLDACYADFLKGDKQSWLDEYRRRCVSLGESITVKTAAGETSGKALDIDTTGALLIELADGTTTTVLAGDVL